MISLISLTLFLLQSLFFNFTLFSQSLIKIKKFKFPLQTNGRKCLPVFPPPPFLEFFSDLPPLPLFKQEGEKQMSHSNPLHKEGGQDTMIYPTNCGFYICNTHTRIWRK